MVMRTTKASKRMATARPKPIILTRSFSSMMKPEKTLIMMIAAAVTTRPPYRKPVTTDSRGSTPWTYASRIRVTRNTS